MATDIRAKDIDPSLQIFRRMAELNESRASTAHFTKKDYDTTLSALGADHYTPGIPKWEEIQSSLLAKDIRASQNLERRFIAAALCFADRIQVYSFLHMDAPYKDRLDPNLVDAICRDTLFEETGAAIDQVTTTYENFAVSSEETKKFPRERLTSMAYHGALGLGPQNRYFRNWVELTARSGFDQSSGRFRNSLHANAAESDISRLSEVVRRGLRMSQFSFPDVYERFIHSSHKDFFIPNETFPEGTQDNNPAWSLIFAAQFEDNPNRPLPIQDPSSGRAVTVAAIAQDSIANYIDVRAKENFEAAIHLLDAYSVLAYRYPEIHIYGYKLTDLWGEGKSFTSPDGSSIQISFRNDFEKMLDVDAHLREVGTNLETLVSDFHRGDMNSIPKLNILIARLGHAVELLYRTDSYIRSHRTPTMERRGERAVRVLAYLIKNIVSADLRRREVEEISRFTEAAKTTGTYTPEEPTYSDLFAPMMHALHGLRAYQETHQETP